MGRGNGRGLLLVGWKAHHHDFLYALGRNPAMELLREWMVGWLQFKMRAHSGFLNVGVHLQAVGVGVTRNPVAKPGKHGRQVDAISGLVSS